MKKIGLLILGLCIAPMSAWAVSKATAARVGQRILEQDGVSKKGGEFEAEGEAEEIKEEIEVDDDGEMEIERKTKRVKGGLALRAEKERSEALTAKIESLELKMDSLAAVLEEMKAQKTSSGVASKFDQIPLSSKGQIDQVANRLKLAELILRKTGRAYDYRAMTTAELRRILQEENSRENSSSAQ